MRKLFIEWITNITHFEQEENCGSHLNFSLVHIDFSFFFISTAIALRGKDGVVFAVEKLIVSKLYESTANRRIFMIDQHIGMVSSLYAYIRWNCVVDIVTALCCFFFGRL